MHFSAKRRIEIACRLIKSWQNATRDKT